MLHVPSTGSRTILTKTATAEFAAHQSRTTPADNLRAVLALVHFIAAATVESIASVADANLMIGLVLVAPMTSRAYIGVTIIARNLNGTRTLGRVERSRGG